MILEEIKAIKSEKKDIKNFGLTFGVVAAILAAMLWWKGKDTYTIFIIVSLAFIFLGYVLPVLLRPLQKAWMVFAVILGWFMTRVLLSVLFYIVFTSIGLGLRLFGKQFLEMEIDNSKKSYWIKRVKEDFKQSDYERQF